MTYDAARSEVFTIVNTAIVANTSLLNGSSTIDVRWPGINKPSVERPANDFYGRVMWHVLRDAQASLGGITGNRRYEALAQLQLQVFSPMSLAGADEHGRKFADAIRKAFRTPSPSGMISFINQVVREAGNDDTHYITNIVVDCIYDDFQ